MGARCSWTGGRGNLARSCANLSCVFSRNVFVDSISGECVPNWANLPIKSSHSRIDLLKSSSMATTRVDGVLGLLPWGVARLRAAFLGPRTCRAASPYVTTTPAAVITACVPRQSEITQTGNLFLCLVGAVIFPVDSGREDSFRAPATAREEKYRRSLPC